MSDEQFELQFFDGKKYQTKFTGTLAGVQKVFSMTRKGWRIVKSSKARPLKPVYRRPRAGRATLTRYNAGAARGEYLAWAKAKGLKSIAVYEGVRIAYNGPKPTHWQGIELRYVNASDFLGDAPAAESDD
jgi:hypothetical protein